MKREAISSVCSMALLIGGCSKRQTGRPIIYVPSSPTASAPAAGQATETVVIEEPPPPAQPQEVAPEEPPVPKPERQPRRAIRNTPNTAEPAAETPPPSPSGDIPALEPRESREQESALRRLIVGVQNDVQQQIAQLDRKRLTTADRKTLEDARGFLGQSSKAFEGGDLQRSLNLARKASLLAAALAQDH